MRPRLRSGAAAGAIVIVLASAMASCTPPSQQPGGAKTPSAKSAAQTGSGDEPLVIRTTLSYTRPQLFSAVTRPTGFGLLRDYHSASAEDLLEITGAWDDTTQTLTTDVTITLKSENLVFVDDPAIAPESETPIRAGRATLREVTCPEKVPAQHPCYLLQILH